MSILSIRKQPGEKSAAVVPAEPWDPWRAMRTLLAWDPFREMSAFPAVDERAVAYTPAFDIKETKDNYLFRADVPGILDKDLEVTVTGNRLTVSGKREEEKEEKSDRYYTYERTYGTFTRSFTLPDGADLEHLRASLDQGVLTVSVPKKPEVQPKKVPIKAESETVKS